MNDTDYCFDCVDNWRDEECLRYGHEIYEDSEACTEFQEMDLVED